MLNGPAVAFPAVFAGAVVGVGVWFITPNPTVIAVLALASAVAVGRYCYRLLQK